MKYCDIYSTFSIKKKEREKYIKRETKKDLLSRIAASINLNKNIMRRLLLLSVAALVLVGCETIAQPSNENTFDEYGFVEHDGSRTVCPEKLLTVRNRLVFPNGENDSLLVNAMLDAFAQESQFLNDTDSHYEDVFLETDRPWDWLDFIKEALEIRTEDNSTFRVKVRWEDLDMAYYVLIGQHR